MSDRLDEHRDRIEGATDEAKGRGKQAWGDVAGDEETRTEGQGDELKGRGEQALGDLKDQAGDLKEKVGG